MGYFKMWFNYIFNWGLLLLSLAAYVSLVNKYTWWIVALSVIIPLAIIAGIKALIDWLGYRKTLKEFAGAKSMSVKEAQRHIKHLRKMGEEE